MGVNYFKLEVKNGEPVHSVAKSQKYNAYVCCVSLKTGKFKPQFWQHYYHVALYLLEW
jgi:hypothetical protein